MLFVKFKESDEIYLADFSKEGNIVRLSGRVPLNNSGFELSRSLKKWDGWDYSEYTTVYDKGEGWIEWSCDGSVRLKG